MSMIVIPICSVLFAYWVSRVAMLLHATRHEIDETLEGDRHPLLLTL
jgi:hypothetical protein